MSFTATTIIIENDTLFDALLHLYIEIRHLDSPFPVIHSDFAQGSDLWLMTCFYIATE